MSDEQIRTTSPHSKGTNLLSVEYEIGPDEVVQFNLHHHAHSTTARRAYWRAWLIPPAFFVAAGVFFLLTIERLELHQRAILAVLAACPAVVYLLIFPWRYRQNIRALVQGMLKEGRNEALFGWRQLQVTSEYIEERGDFGATLRKWWAIERVTVTDDALYVYLNTMSAIIVPSHAFETSAAFERCAELVSSCQAAAQ